MYLLNYSLNYQSVNLRNFHLSIREHSPLPDRNALDDVALDILRLTQKEWDEVYWAVCELVKNRLEKARSV